MDSVVDFETARSIVRALQLVEASPTGTSYTKVWSQYSATLRPSYIPGAPWKAYKEQWKGLKDWLVADDNTHIEAARVDESKRYGICFFVNVTTVF